jgi:DNA excision repair protein ERCC-5
MKRDILEENILLIEELEKSSKAFSYFSQENLEELKTLLKLCGIPYVEAPFEAESQCAYLESIGLVDGVVTEDSDVLLFGSRKVYRNIFDRNKFVEKYDMNFIEKEMGLSREDLIKMALFMGSDYTMGVRGIAAVNAIEIISAFPGEDGLIRFKRWVDIKQQIYEQQQQ